LLTRLQYVLNVAHDDGSFSGRSRVLQDSAAYSAVIESLALAFGYRILPSARMEANMRAACNCDGRGQTARRIFRLQAASPSFPMATTMRLVSFNILEGFRPLAASSAERRLMDRDRAEAARTVVAELSPDILVLNEALFCRQHGGREVDYAALFGFRCAAVALYEEEWGNAILSRFPIVASSEMRIYNRGGLLATIETGCLLPPAPATPAAEQGARLRPACGGVHRPCARLR
jgi:hypothetical protein